MARILIVDDEPTLARALARAFRSHEVVTAYSGKEALDACAQQSFDVVVCDLMMPELTGMDLHRHFQETGSDLSERMVFMTGGDYTPEQTSFRARVGDRCLMKPLDIAHLRRLVDSLIPE